jgi:hypothetical protein
MFECGSGPEPLVVVGLGGGGGSALYDAGSGAVQPSRPLPSVIACHRNMISGFGNGFTLGPFTKTARSSVPVDQSHIVMSLPTSPLHHGTPLKGWPMGNCDLSMSTVWSYGVVKYQASSSGSLCGLSELPAGTVISGSMWECGPGAAIGGDVVVGDAGAAVLVFVGVTVVDGGGGPGTFRVHALATTTATPSDHVVILWLTYAILG